MLSNYLGEFLALATIHFLAVVAPGPDFAVTIRQSVRFGRWVGICTALGIGAGISVHVLYTVLGVGALMHTTPWLLTVAKVLGGGYIVYLGVSLLRSKPPVAMDPRIRQAIAQYRTILNFEISESADNSIDTQLRYGLADLTHDGDQPPPPAYAWTPQDDGQTSEQDNWKSGDMF